MKHGGLRVAADRRFDVAPQAHVVERRGGSVGGQENQQRGWGPQRLIRG
jgi:hypothetical protein